MNKKTIVFLVFLLISFVTLDKFRSSTAQEKVSEGKIGDVKYSVLEPTKFTKINGEGWVLMDGRSIEGSDLFTETGFKTAYDAQGVFIRGLNLKRDVKTGDPDGEKRLLGSYQWDMVIDHKHTFKGTGTGPRLGGDYKGNGVALQQMETANPISTNGDIPTSGSETRPKNIALYTYIKIDN